MYDFQGSKKMRNKPQVQQGVDVKALAQTRDGLSRVNTTTLIAYLRSEGVSCKVKDKKGDLVAKVMTHLNLPLPSDLEARSEQIWYHTAVSGKQLLYIVALIRKM